MANELFAVRTPNYVPMYPTLYQADPEQFATILAEIFLVSTEKVCSNTSCIFKI